MREGTSFNNQIESFQTLLLLALAFIGSTFRCSESVGINFHTLNHLGLDTRTEFFEFACELASIHQANRCAQLLWPRGRHPMQIP